VAKKRMNYQESCFEINEQLGVFGIIGDGGVTPYGNPCKTVTPVRKTQIFISTLHA
jgi:hypothetical protein